MTRYKRLDHFEICFGQNTSSIFEIAYVNGKFVAVGTNDYWNVGEIAYSDNGINWTAVTDNDLPSVLSETDNK